MFTAVFDACSSVVHLLTQVPGHSPTHLCVFQAPAVMMPLCCLIRLRGLTVKLHPPGRIRVCLKLPGSGEHPPNVCPVLTALMLGVQKVATKKLSHISPANPVVANIYTKLQSARAAVKRKFCCKTELTAIRWKCCCLLLLAPQ